MSAADLYAFAGHTAEDEAAADASAQAEYEYLSLHEVADLLPVASLLLVLQDLKNSCVTSPEKRATEDCIEAVREAFGVKP